MRILWIEDEPKRKINQFSKFASYCGKPFDSKSLKEQNEILHSLGFEIINSFEVIRKLILEDNISEETPCERCAHIFNFLNKYDLILCDVNLSADRDKQNWVSEQDFDTMMSRTGVSVRRHYEGEALFDMSLCFANLEERKKLASKFYFFSAYDGLNNVKKRMKELFTEEKQEEWSAVHCIENKTNAKNQLLTSNFKDKRYERYFRDWIYDSTKSSYYINDNDDIECITACMNEKGKWEISFRISSSQKEITLVQDVDFTATEEIPRSTEERIFDAIMGIEKLKIKAYYSKYYDLNVIQDNEDDFDEIIVKYSNFVRGKTDDIKENTFGDLTKRIRRILEQLEKRIEEVIFPNNSFSDWMEKRERIFWKQKGKIPQNDNKTSYPDTEINNAKNQKPLSAEEQIWVDFHKSWKSVTPQRKSITRIYLSCPLYIGDTIHWAYNQLLSAYEEHSDQINHEKKRLSVDILPTKIHMFNASVSALLMLLDFYRVISLGNNNLLGKMRLYRPYQLTVKGKADRR